MTEAFPEGKRSFRAAQSSWLYHHREIQGLSIFRPVDQISFSCCTSPCGENKRQDDFALGFKCRFHSGNGSFEEHFDEFLGRSGERPAQCPYTAAVDRFQIDRGRQLSGVLAIVHEVSSEPFEHRGRKVLLQRLPSLLGNGPHPRNGGFGDSKMNNRSPFVGTDLLQNGDFFRGFTAFAGSLRCFFDGSHFFGQEKVPTSGSICVLSPCATTRRGILRSGLNSLYVAAAGFVVRR